MRDTTNNHQLHYGRNSSGKMQSDFLLLLKLELSCWWMCGEKNTHVFWECLKSRDYWDDVWAELTMILAHVLPKTHVVLYLGNLTHKNVQHADRYLVEVLLAATKRAIPRKWYKEDPTTLRNSQTQLKRYIIWKDSHMF